MTTVTRSEKWPSSTMFLALTIGLAVLFGSFGVSLALPKGTYLLCKCTCRAEDELGKPHYGSPNGVWYTTSRDACDLFPTCKVGSLGLEGIATDCLGQEQAAITPGSIPGVLQQQPTAPGGMRGPTGTILRRGIEEGEQPAEPTPGAPTSPEQPTGK
jgi:hypothetical protein